MGMHIKVTPMRMLGVAVFASFATALAGGCYRLVH